MKWIRSNEWYFYEEIKSILQSRTSDTGIVALAISLLELNLRSLSKCPQGSYTKRNLSVFTSHVIKTKSRKNSINKFKNLEYDRWLQYKQPRYSQKCITQIYRALYGDAMFVPFWGAQIWRPWRNKNICRWVLLLKLKFLL